MNKPEILKDEEIMVLMDRKCFTTGGDIKRIEDTGSKRLINAKRVAVKQRDDTFQKTLEGMIEWGLEICPATNPNHRGIFASGEYLGVDKGYAPAPMNKRMKKAKIIMDATASSPGMKFDEAAQVRYGEIVDQLEALDKPLTSSQFNRREQIARIICCFSKDNNSCAECKYNTPAFPFPDCFNDIREKTDGIIDLLYPQKICPCCRGSGMYPEAGYIGTDVVTCSNCNGTGKEPNYAQFKVGDKVIIKYSGRTGIILKVSWVDDSFCTGRRLYQYTIVKGSGDFNEWNLELATCKGTGKVPDLLTDEGECYHCDKKEGILVRINPVPDVKKVVCMECLWARHPKTALEMVEFILDKDEAEAQGQKGGG